MSQKLFVGNLSFQTNASELRQLFVSIGPIVSCTIASSRCGSLGFGFVEFVDESSAKNAISVLNNTYFGGRKIVVEFCQGNGEIFEKNLVKYPFVKVEVIYEIMNGLSGLKRDVILRLLKLFWYKPMNIRAIIGVCGSYYLWRHHKSFTRNRPINHPTTFRPLKKRHMLMHTPSGVQCTFTTTSVSTLFLDLPIKKGIFRWNLKIKYGVASKRNTSHFVLGVVQRMTDVSRSTHGGVLEESTTSGFCFSRRPTRNGNFLLQSSLCLHGVPDSTRNIQCKKTVVTDGSLVGLEVDAALHTVVFFVNEKKVGYGISDIPLPAYMGMSASGQVCSCISVSLQRLPSPTPSSVACMLLSFLDDYDQEEDDSDDYYVAYNPRYLPKFDDSGRPIFYINSGGMIFRRDDLW